MQIRILAPAEAELLDAVAYYNSEKVKGLAMSLRQRPAERSLESSSIHMPGRPYRNTPAGVG